MRQAYGRQAGGPAGGRAGGRACGRAGGREGGRAVRWEGGRGKERPFEIHEQDG